MKYLIIFFTIFIFIGCNKKNKSKAVEINNTKETNITQQIKQKKEKIKTIIINDKIKLNFKNNKLTYPSQKVILLFYDKDFYSKEQMRVLNKLNIKYYKTDNEFLKKYFNIMYYPTIVILDKNKTVKFENFTPYEILKTEGF